jgi:hypothetical protein
MWRLCPETVFTSLRNEDIIREEAKHSELVQVCYMYIHKYCNRIIAISNLFITSNRQRQQKS